MSLGGGAVKVVNWTSLGEIRNFEAGKEDLLREPDPRAQFVPS